MRNSVIALLSILVFVGFLAGCAEMQVAQESAQSQKVNLDDMVGMKAAYLDSDMESRGFKNVGGYKTESTSYTNWWNVSTKQCVSVATRQGRVDEILPTDQSECEKHAKKAAHEAAQPQKVNLDDMVGMKAAYLDSDMESRGFKNVGGYQSDGAAFTTWWNASTKQCVSVATREGRVDKIESIFEGNCQ